MQQQNANNRGFFGRDIIDHAAMLLLWAIIFWPVTIVLAPLASGLTRMSIQTAQSIFLGLNWFGKWAADIGWVHRFCANVLDVVWYGVRSVSFVLAPYFAPSLANLLRPWIPTWVVFLLQHWLGGVRVPEMGPDDGSEPGHRRARRAEPEPRPALPVKPASPVKPDSPPPEAIPKKKLDTITKFNEMLAERPGGLTSPRSAPLSPRVTKYTFSSNGSADAASDFFGMKRSTSQSSVSRPRGQTLLGNSQSYQDGKSSADMPSLSDQPKSPLRLPESPRLSDQPMSPLRLVVSPRPSPKVTPRTEELTRVGSKSVRIDIPAGSKSEPQTRHREPSESRMREVADASSPRSVATGHERVQSTGAVDLSSSPRERTLSGSIPNIIVRRNTKSTNAPSEALLKARRLTPSGSGSDSKQ